MNYVRMTPAMMISIGLVLELPGSRLGTPIAALT
jgi:hypothetical protein